MDGLYDQLRIALHQVWRRRWLAMARRLGRRRARLAGHRPDPVQLRGEGAAVRPDAVDPAQPDRHHPRRAQQPAAAPQADPHLERESRRASSAAPISTASSPASATSPGVVGELRAAHHHHRPARRRARDQGDLEHLRLLQRPERAHRRGDRPGPDRPASSSRTCPATAARPASRCASSTRSCAAARPRCRRPSSAGVEFEQRFMGVLPGAGSIGDRMSAARIELANLEQQIAAANGALNAMRGQLAATPQSLPGIGDGGGTATRPARPAGRPAQPATSPSGWTEFASRHRLRRASRSRACARSPRSERAQRQYRRHPQSRLRLAARDDGRARGAARRRHRAPQPAPGRSRPARPRASRPSPASPPSRPG